MFNTKFIQIAGWSVLCLTVSFAGCSEKAGIPSGYDIPAETAVQIEALSVADTDCGFDFIWSFDDRVSVAAGAGEPVSARVYPYSDYQTNVEYRKDSLTFQTGVRGGSVFSGCLPSRVSGFCLCFRDFFGGCHECAFP